MSVKRIISLLLLLSMLLTLSSAAAYKQLDDPAQLPETDENGFLPAGEEAVYYRDFAEGRWFWLDSEVRIEINRTNTGKLVYYIADICCNTGTTMYTHTWNQKKPGRTAALPQDIAAAARCVYAQSGDFYSYRVQHDRYPGNIVRDGKMLYNKSYSKMVHATPNLATIGFFYDGRVEVNEAWKKSAKTYVKEGARDVLAFGPILLKDGEIQDLSDKAYRHNEPRSCFGVIGPRHYVGLVVEGRKDHSEGATLKTCAEILAEYGCTDAINLDGGNTAAMLFMGESVQMTDAGGVDVPDRAIPDILCAGIY